MLQLIVAQRFWSMLSRRHHTAPADLWHSIMIMSACLNATSCCHVNLLHIFFHILKTVTGRVLLPPSSTVGPTIAHHKNHTDYLAVLSLADLWESLAWSGGTILLSGIVVSHSVTAPADLRASRGSNAFAADARRAAGGLCCGLAASLQSFGLMDSFVRLDESQGCTRTTLSLQLCLLCVELRAAQQSAYNCNRGDQQWTRTLWCKIKKALFN